MKNKINTPVAVLDLGSNSFRLVVYKETTYPFKIVTQEREFIQLGENMDKNNKISSVKLNKARKVLKNLVATAKKNKVYHIYILATAAIRESSNGKDIFKNISKDKNISINIISSLKEASYAAYGVISSINKPRGIVADLGGGSLEIAGVDFKNIIFRKSLNIGLLRKDSSLYKINKLKFDQTIINQFNKLNKIEFPKNKHLYVIGGAWRNLGKLALHLKGFKKNKLHGYILNIKSLENLYHELSITTEQKIRKINIVQVNRVSHIGLAAYILYMLALHFNVEEIVFVRYGIREGFLHQLSS